MNPMYRTRRRRGGLGRGGGGGDVPLRRGFTLIEIIIAIAIMLGVAAIVLPITMEDSKRAAFTEAQSQLEAVLLSARAEAQRSGRMLRVVVLGAGEDTPTLRVEELPPDDGTADDGAPKRGRLVDERDLPPGVRVGRTRESVERGVTAPSPGDGTAPIEDDPGAQPRTTEVQLALMLPDGQIAVTRPIYLGGPDGRVGDVAVNSWTGAVTVSVLPPLGLDGGTDGGVDEPPAPDMSAGGPDAGAGSVGKQGMAGSGRVDAGRGG